MKNIAFIVFLVAVVSAPVFGQDKKVSDKGLSLTGTTWLVYWADLRWNHCVKTNGKINCVPHGELTFLKDGKLTMGGTSDNGEWNVVGDKISGFVPNMISNMKVSFKGNEMRGEGEVGMSNLVFSCLRLVRRTRH